MALQYISNEHGEKIAVIIPIQEWESLMAKHEGLKDLLAQDKFAELNSTRKKPSDFVGMISKEEAQEIQNYLKKARTEWDRCF
jgi:REP element-mobilizing transposase RayT